MADRTSGRLAYLDWLRFIVVLSLAPFHAAISYSGLGVVFVYDTPIRDALLAGSFSGETGPYALRLFTVFFDNWFMHLLFFISGIGAAVSLEKRSAGEFIGERANRLMIPLFFGTLFVVSVQSWIRARAFGFFSGGFLSFYPHFFNGILDSTVSRNNFGWGQLWFLAYLFVFSVISLPLLLSARKRRMQSGTGSPSFSWTTGLPVFLPALWIGALEAVFRPGWPGYQNLVNDWANFTVYLSFFLFGFAAGTDRRFLETAERYRAVFLLLGLAAFLARLGVYRVVQVDPGYNPAHMTTHGFRGIAAYFLTAACLGYGRRYLNREGKALRLARDTAFPLYILHFIPVTAITWLLLGSGLPVWVRWAVTVILSWIAVAVFTELARFVPALRWFFGIRSRERTRV